MNQNFEKIVETLAKNKGLTKKTAQRLLVDLVNNQEKFNQFWTQIVEFKQNFGICPTCFYLTYQNECEICSDPQRNQDLICVVSSVLDVLNIEQHKKYRGLYAVLGGEINLVKNLGPDDLKIGELFQRTKENVELILALNATFEGELTANYLTKIAEKQNIKTSRIAKGIPIGGMLDYMDEETLESAFNNRK